MVTHTSGDPSEQLRELLRRMEQIPEEETPPGNNNEAANPPVPFLAGFGLQLRREHAVQLTVVAIGAAAALAAGWALLFGRPGASSAAAERQPVPVAASQPAKQPDAPYRLAAASETILPRADAG